MLDNVLYEIQAEIMKKIPIKSLLKFRSISKSWKSLIDSSKFITDHSVCRNLPHHLLLRYNLHSEVKYVSIDDDDDFPQHKYSLTVPMTFNLLKHALILGSSHGLLCLYGFYDTFMAVLWNPSIRKSVGIAISNVLFLPEGATHVGFGVCPRTSDPMLVKITTRIHNQSDFDTKKYNISWEAEVYSVSSGVWRSIPIALPHKPVFFTWNQVVVDGVIYWHAYDNTDLDAGPCNMVISFDLTSEEFGEVFLPDSLVHSSGHLVISKLMDSLVVIESYNEAEKPVCDVWMMKHGAPKSFKNLFTIKAPDNSILNRVLGFRENGEPIMQRIDGSKELTTLEVYKPSSKHIYHLGIYGNGAPLTCCSVSSYTETLLLLHQSDSIIQ